MFINQGAGRYRGRRLTEAIVAHADSLISGDENAAQLLKQPSSSELEDLFEMSEQLHKTLVPVNPRELFVAELKTELQNSQVALLAASDEQHRHRATRAASSVGVFLSIVAVTALVTRLIGIVVVVVTFWSRRHHSTVAACSSIN